MPAALLASRAAFWSDSPAASAAVRTEMTVSPAPETSNNFGFSGNAADDFALFADQHAVGSESDHEFVGIVCRKDGLADGFIIEVGIRAVIEACHL